MVNFYIFNEKESKCVVFEDKSKRIVEGDKEIQSCREAILPLTLQSKNSFQWVYKHQDAILTIEKHSNKVISATLKNVEPGKGYSLGTVFNYDEEDWGRAVYHPQKKDYVLKKGLPKIFRVFKNDYNPDQPWTFYFNHDWHLVLKDKDKVRPWYWYFFDYTPELAEFIYKTLSPHIKPEQGEVVAIPGELGDVCRPWGDNYAYGVNYFYCGYDPEKTKYDFSKETAENWKKNHLPTALVITFLPTYFKNYSLPDELQLTGTRWFQKIWEVFGVEKAPVVVKAYPGWVYANLYCYYPELYKQISAITELPSSIDNREVGKANLLVFFNCPWLGKSVANRIKYEL